MLPAFAMAVVPRQLLLFRNCDELVDVVYNLYEEHLSVSLGSTFNRTFGILLSMRNKWREAVVKPTKKLMETVTVFHAYDDHSCH